MNLHFKAVNAPDYFQRRDLPCPDTWHAAQYGATYRLAHINMYMASRASIQAAGPGPDGTSAEVIYSVESMEALDKFLACDPYVVGGVFSSWSIRPLTNCIVPSTQVPVCLDGTRRITIVEQAVADQGRVGSALQHLQRRGVLVIGGAAANDTAMAWISTPDRDEALRLWADAIGMNASGQASCRPLVWVM